MRGFGLVSSIVSTIFSLLLLEVVACQDLSQPPSVVLNQHWLEQTWNSQRPIDPVSLLVVDDTVAERLDPTDRVALIGYLLKQVPESAVVYPSDIMFKRHAFEIYRMFKRHAFKTYRVLGFNLKKQAFQLWRF